MKYGSLFSGIEAASLAFEPLGWKPQWFAEVDPFCCKVLEKHWQNVPNLGDVNNNFDATPVDLIIGGSPCPSFSLAGHRRGMADNRGILALKYCEIIDKMKPKWFIWENVPGVLSSHNGEDFEVILNEMVKSGYSVVWTILDARCFGLPQSRKRLFVVGRLGNRCFTEILAESKDNGNITKKHEDKWQEHAFRDRDLDVIPICLRGRKHGVVVECMDYFGCLRASVGIATNYIWDGRVVRKLTPVEYERLQGIPDNHTLVDEKTTDNERWKAIGNSMAVPVVRWIGEIIDENTIS